MSLPPPPPPPRPAVRRPVHRGVWVGAAILALGVLAAGGWLFARLPAVSDELDRFHRAEPGLPAVFTVDDTVDWDVFIEPSTASQSGFRFEIVDDSGEPMPLGNDHGFTYNWFSRSGRSIASVVLAPGTYELRVVDGPSTVAVGASPAGRILWALGGALVIGGVLVVGGAAVMVVSAVRDTRRRNENAEPPPPSPWSSGEWPAADGPTGSRG